MVTSGRAVDMTQDQLLHIYPSVVGTATIAASGTLSAAVDLAGLQLTGIYMGTAWGGTAALSFQVSHDGTTYSNFYDAYGEVTVSSTSAAANQFVALDPLVWAGVRHFKVRSGTAAAGVSQSAQRQLVLVGRLV